MSSANVLKIFCWDTRNFLANHVQLSSQACVNKWDTVVNVYRRLAIVMTIKRNCCSINSEMFKNLANRRIHHRNSFAISANLRFQKTFVEKRYNLFSHWNRDRERLSRFVNTAKHIRDILQRSTHNRYCSILQSNLVILIEAWLEKSVFRFQFEKFERRTDSNFEQQNQILILGQNAWPGLTVIRRLSYHFVQTRKLWKQKVQQWKFFHQFLSSLPSRVLGGD